MPTKPDTTKGSKKNFSKVKTTRQLAAVKRPRARLASRSLQNLFLNELQELHNAEVQMISAIPRMIRGAAHPALQQALQRHLEETQLHLTRLHNAFSLLDIAPKKKTCQSMEALVRRSDEVLRDSLAPSLRDAALIAATQKIEHHEIAGYGCACAWAQLLGHDAVLALLSETLAEEKAADELLTEVAESSIHEQALRV